MAASAVWGLPDEAAGPRGALMASVMGQLQRGATAVTQIARDTTNGLFPTGGGAADICSERVPEDSLPFYHRPEATVSRRRGCRVGQHCTDRAKCRISIPQDFCNFILLRAGILPPHSGLPGQPSGARALPLHGLPLAESPPRGVRSHIVYVVLFIALSAWRLAKWLKTVCTAPA